MGLLGITGGSGYLGRSLTQRLAERGEAAAVVQIGRSDPGAARFVPFDMSAGRVGDLPALERIVHAAAFVPPDQRGADRLDCESVNGKGTRALLHALDKAPLRRVVNISSAHVWDTEQPATPTNAYEASKLSAELFLHAYARHHGFEAVNLRMGYVYGPGMVHGTMFRVFMRNALANRPIDLFREGKDRLHLIHRDDAVDAIIAALDTGELHGTFDICSPRAVTTLEVARTIIELTGSASECRLQSGGAVPAPRRLDTRAALRAFGFEARVDLGEGIATMLREEQRR